MLGTWCLKRCESTVNMFLAHFKCSKSILSFINMLVVYTYVRIYDYIHIFTHVEKVRRFVA